MKKLLKFSFLAVLGLSISACDFNGPWEYFPEEREIYTGIYTYGYVSDFSDPEICFSKVYELDEASAESFAFYDSAHVTLKGRFSYRREEVDTTLVLSGANCFSKSGYAGIVGESYKLDAYFEWDSAGHKVESRYQAVATIPNPVEVKGLNVPLQDGGYEWHKANKYNEYRFKFLEYPMDMEFVKCALDYDKTVGGVVSVLYYGIENEESVNTTINEMFSGMTEADSAGYRGIAMHDPLESEQNFGFTENRRIAGFNSLDTLYLMNMMLPLGRVYVNLYTTDHAYVDYEGKVKESVSDSRIVPESNIENGMGVFFGTSKTSLFLDVVGDGVALDHIAIHNCENKSGDFADSWDSRGCRLYEDAVCAGNSLLFGDYRSSGLLGANAYAYEGYRDSSYYINRDAKACYPSHVKAAMMLDTTKWSLFLPDTVNAEDKAEAYADGLKRYCVASNFESNHIADCSELEKECLEDSEKNNCKEYLWIWCADRDWDLESYAQCRSALVSRYYLEEQKSSIIHREIEEVCSQPAYVGMDSENEFYYPICSNWCELDDGEASCR